VRKYAAAVLSDISTTSNKMLRQLTCLLSIYVALSGAVKLNVASSGGNASSPLMYGIMFEVRDQGAS
jgi:hypothetical protein